MECLNGTNDLLVGFRFPQAVQRTRINNSASVGSDPAQPDGNISGARSRNSPLLDCPFPVGEQMHGKRWVCSLVMFVFISPPRVWRRRSAMDAPSLHDMNRAKLTIQDSIAETRRSLKNAKRRAASQDARWVLSESMRRVSLIAYVLAGYDASAAVKYLEACGRARRWPKQTHAELLHIVEDLFIGADLAEIADLTDSLNPLDSVAFKVAAKHVHESMVVEGGRKLNVERGVAPSTNLMLRRADADRMQFAEAVRPPAHGMFVSNRGGKWVQRLRARWGGRFGSIPAREGVSHDEIRAKVCNCFITHRATQHNIRMRAQCFRAQNGRAWRTTSACRVLLLP